MLEEEISEETAALYLKDVEPLWRAFWFHMHLMAKNLEEFGEDLTMISDEVFAYHVVGQKNDLARWVQEVIGDAWLAQRLLEAKNKEEAAAVVKERVAALKQGRVAAV